MTSLIVSEISRDSDPSPSARSSFSAGASGDPEAANETFLTPLGARCGFFNDVLGLPASALDDDAVGGVAVGSNSPLSKSFLFDFRFSASSSDSDSMNAPGDETTKWSA